MGLGRASQGHKGRGWDKKNFSVMYDGAGIG